jgi:hypothetical protein
MSLLNGFDGQGKTVGLTGDQRFRSVFLPAEEAVLCIIENIRKGRGNVRVRQQGDKAQVTGDGGNAIRAYAGSIVISGAGTTINGQSDPVRLEGVDHLNVRLRKGNNVILLEGDESGTPLTIPGDLTIIRTGTLQAHESNEYIARDSDR